MRDAQFLIDRWGQLKTERSPFEQDWREIAEFIRPMRQEFRAIARAAAGLQRPTSDEYITDSTAYVALDNYVGGLYGFMSSPANRWFELETEDKALMEEHNVKLHLDAVTTRILKSFGPGASSFYTEAPELYGDTSAFGTGVFFSEWRRDGGFHDRTFAIIHCWPDMDDYGRIDTMFRELPLTPAQAAKKWGEDSLSDKLKDRAKKAKQEHLEFLHVVHPNDDYAPSTLGPKGFPFTEVYLEPDTKHVIAIRGRREFPYQVPRWSGGGKYGYGLGRRTLPDVKTINAADRANLEATEFQARPAVLAPDEDVVETLRPIPRGITYGGINHAGRRMVDFLAPSGNLAITHEALEVRRQSFRDAWMFSLMQVMGRTGMTPLEVLERQEDKMRIMGPSVARIQVEFLSPLIVRRYAEMERRGLLPEPPPELEQAALRIEYTSPMARAQRSAEAQSTLRFIEGTAAVAQVRPDAVDHINGDEAVKVLAEGFAAPARVLNEPRVVEEIRAQRAAEQELAATLQAGEQGADIAETLSRAEVAEGNDAA